LQIRKLLPDRLKLRGYATIVGCKVLLLLGRPLNGIDNANVDEVLGPSSNFIKTQRLLPSGLSRLKLRSLLIEALSQSGNLCIQTLYRRGLIVGGQRYLLLPADRNFLDVREKRGQAIKLAGQERVKFVIVAFAAAQGRGQPNARNI